MAFLSGSGKGQIMNLLLVHVRLLVQCGKLHRGVTCSGESKDSLSGAEEQGVFSPLPACFHSSLPTASSCQMEAVMDPCRSKNDALLPSGKLLQSWQGRAQAAAQGALQLLAVEVLQNQILL